MYSKIFTKLDFSTIYEYYHAKSEARKARPAAEKKAEKAERDKNEAPYMYCKWDGRKEKVGNFRVEPPGLFRGRGEHPKTGKLKKRVLPEQITINIGKKTKVPPPPPGHNWKAVQHDNKATWLAASSHLASRHAGPVGGWAGLQAWHGAWGGGGPQRARGAPVHLGQVALVFVVSTEGDSGNVCSRLARVDKFSLLTRS